MSEKAITFTADDQRKSNPRAGMVRVELRSASRYAGQRKHDLRIGPQPKYVDQKRADQNRVIIEPPTPSQMRKLVNARRAQRDTTRALKSNARIAAIGVIGFGSEATKIFERLPPDKQDEALLAVGEAIAVEANTTLEGMTWHGDESSGHAHPVWCGYNLDGVPLSETMKRGMMTRFQDRMAEVMAKHAPGIERGRSKWARIEAGEDYAATLHKSVAELHRDLPADLEAKRAELVEAKARVDEMEQRLQKAQAKADEAEGAFEKLEKRIATYEKRFAARSADLAKLQATVDHLETREAEILQRERERSAELDKRETEVSDKEARVEAAAARYLQEVNDARAEAAAELDDVERREAALELKQSAFTRFAERMTQVVRDVFGALNLPMPAKLTDAVQQLECEIAERKPELEDPFLVPAENPVDDTSGPGF